MTVPWIQSLYLDCGSVASGSDKLAIVGKVPYAGTVVAVEYVPGDAMSANNATNGRVFSLYNRSTGGTGTAVVARVSTGTANTLGDNISKNIATSSGSVVAQGDVLEWESSHVSDGIADPGGKVKVDISRS